MICHVRSLSISNVVGIVRGSSGADVVVGFPVEGDPKLKYKIVKADTLVRATS